MSQHPGVQFSIYAKQEALREHRPHQAIVLVSKAQKVLR